MSITGVNGVKVDDIMIDRLIAKIAEKTKKTPFDVEPYRDMVSYLSTKERNGEPWVEEARLVDELIDDALSKAVEVKKYDVLEKLSNTHEGLLCMLGKKDFDAFLRAVEWKRETKKQFYLPRRKVLRPVVDALQDLTDEKLKLLAISLPPGVGKAIASDTPVLTKRGWVKHGDLIEGDEVLNRDGLWVRVMRVHPKVMCDRKVVFANGESIICHERHEWVVRNAMRSARYKIAETRDIERMFEEQKWVEDKWWRGPAISVPPHFPVTGIVKEDPNKAYKVGVSLGRSGKPVEHKWIMADKQSRLALLAGLMDETGHIYGFNGRAELRPKTDEQAESMVTLIDTFGWERTYYKGKQTRNALAVRFCPTEMLPFKKLSPGRRYLQRSKKLVLERIEHVEPVEGNCITVGGDGTYLVGKNLIVTHNTTLALFYVCFLGGMNPERPILICSHSNSFVRGAYDECLRIMDPSGEYQYKRIFPDAPVVGTNAKDCRIDLGKGKRFETIEFTSTGSSNAGLYRAESLLYCDDLVSGREVALSKERLDNLWGTYATDLTQRKKGDHCRELHIATRWSVHDVIGRLEELHGNEPWARFIRVPAVDEHGESNFDYPFGVGFSTDFYREQKGVMEDVDWKALYMNEPIEREGLLYDKDELRRYFELPDGRPDAILSVCDTKDRGEDDCVMPVVYVYGQNWYVQEILCDNSNPEIVDDLLVDCLLRHKVQISRFESNSAGGRVAKTVQERVKARGGRTKIETAWTSANKQTKILVHAPVIKEHCLFLDDSVSDRKYKKALGKLCSYTTAGKNKHDDVPDAFAQFAILMEEQEGSKVQFIKRPF